MFSHTDRQPTLGRATIILLSISCAGVMMAAAVPGLAATPLQTPPTVQLVPVPTFDQGPLVDSLAAPKAALPGTPAITIPPVLSDLAEAKLRPGGYIWTDAQPSGDTKVVVDISEQRAYVYRAGTLVAVTTVSSGRAGHRTPLGTFRITEKHAVHYSSKYDNAPMPYMQRLTNDGVALHAGRIPGVPASHGCVRLPRAFAEKLFGVTMVGTEVMIAA